jgi:hypothetical protein
MCGSNMVLSTRADVSLLPGTSETHRRQIREWTCPECDYFEEAAEDDR